MIKTIVVPRIARRGAREFFKVSKRREMDISIVAAGFCVETRCAERRDRTRGSPYGGVAATPARARKTEAALLGKPLERGDACERAAGAARPSSRRSTMCAAARNIGAD